MLISAVLFPSKFSFYIIITSDFMAIFLYLALITTIEVLSVLTFYIGRKQVVYSRVSWLLEHDLPPLIPFYDFDLTPECSFASPRFRATPMCAILSLAAESTIFGTYEFISIFGYASPQNVRILMPILEHSPITRHFSCNLEPSKFIAIIQKFLRPWKVSLFMGAWRHVFAAFTCLPLISMLLHGKKTIHTLIFILPMLKI